MIYRKERDFLKGMLGKNGTKVDETSRRGGQKPTEHYQRGLPTGTEWVAGREFRSAPLMIEKPREGVPLHAGRIQKISFPI